MDPRKGKSPRHCSKCKAEDQERSDHDARNHDAVLARERGLASDGGNLLNNQKQGHGPIKATDVPANEAAQLILQDMLRGSDNVTIPAEITRLMEALSKIVQVYFSDCPPSPQQPSPVADLTARFSDLPAAGSQTPSSSSKPPLYPSTANSAAQTPPAQTPPAKASPAPSTPVSRLFKYVRESKSDLMMACLKDVLQQVLALCKPDGAVGHSSMTAQFLRRRGGEQLYQLVVRLENALRPLKQVVGIKRATSDEEVSEEQVKSVRFALERLTSEGLIKPLKLDLSDDAAAYLLQEHLLKHFLSVELLSFFKLRSEKELYPALGALLLELVKMDPRRDRLVGAISAQETLGTRAVLEDARVCLAEETVQSFAGRVGQDELSAKEGAEISVEGTGAEKRQSALEAGMEGVPVNALDQAFAEALVNLLIWHEGNVSCELSKGPVEFVTIQGGSELMEGTVEGKVSREKLAESLSQGTSELLAIILSNLKRGLYKDNEPHSAWIILTSLELWFGMRATLVDSTLGEMKMEVEVAGPYRLYDLSTKELHPEAELVAKMLVQLVLPNMSRADAEKWSESSQLFEESLENYRLRKLQKREEKLAEAKKTKVAQEEAANERNKRVVAEGRVAKLIALCEARGVEIPKDFLL